jgi:hypothetical protein
MKDLGVLFVKGTSKSQFQTWTIRKMVIIAGLNMEKSYRRLFSVVFYITFKRE